MMTKSYIDLHMHSMYSDDGEYTPTQLVDMCHETGVKIMAIADHNWVKANEEAKKHADELGMTYIPAIEIDCTYKGVNLHVLGYGIDNQEVFNQLGEDIEKQELAYSMNDSRYDDHELLKPYRQGGERSDNPYVNFYWDYYAQGKPCYTEIHFPTLEETIQLIHQHGGVGLLAHPGNNLKGQFELFDEMVALGLDGVECFSSYHTTETNEYFYNKAKELNVLYTCGSDFHGKTKPSIHLGENGCLNPQEIEDCLKAHHLI